ncbi:ankyrin repeat domain-containing protein [Leptospira levettii]|uniref:ankyrin repeat domain-containing protein n=1 Tax=Leptospira levettii TaxID=2023178 RepID=UPI001092FE41|nr:ankyrin repeat domain-containing protein [Leptospira levettii]TGM78613.1 ankyrin repeat domain-containing protein [Leptospira levettii]
MKFFLTLTLISFSLLFANDELFDKIDSEIRRNNIEALRLLLKKVPNINDVSKNWDSPYVKALIGANSHEVMDIFFEKGANPNLKIDLNGHTYPIFIAFTNRNRFSFAAVVNHSKIDTSVVNEQGETIETHLMGANGNNASANNLCILFNSKKFKFNTKDKNGYSPTDVAIINPQISRQGKKTENNNAPELLKIFLKKRRATSDDFVNLWGGVEDNMACVAFLLDHGAEFPNDKQFADQMLDVLKKIKKEKYPLIADKDFITAVTKYKLEEKVNEIALGINKSKEKKEEEFFRGVSYQSWKEIAIDGDSAVGKVARIGMKVKIFESYGLGLVESNDTDEIKDGGIFEIHFEPSDRKEIKKYKPNEIIFVKFRIKSIFRDKSYNVARGAVGDMLEITTRDEELKRLYESR